MFTHVKRHVKCLGTVDSRVGTAIDALITYYRGCAFNSVVLKTDSGFQIRVGG